MSTEIERLIALMEGVSGMMEAMELQAEVIDKLVGKVGALEIVLAKEVIGAKVSLVLITMLAKESGMTEARFMAMTAQACELAEVTPGFPGETDKKAKASVDEILEKMKGAGQ